MIIKQGKANKLNYKIFDNRDNMGKEAALDTVKAINEVLKRKSEVNMIFAAAPSQGDFYKYFLLNGDVDFSKINAFHMDEYIGLDGNAPQAFGRFLRDRLFSKKNFKSVNYINGNAEEPEDECTRYSELLNKYKCDIVCMGIGENGHIAFNDPHVAFFDDLKAVKIVELDNICRNQQVNDGCFVSLEQVPKHAVTLTIPTLIAPEYIFCIVPAATKAKAVYRTITGEISEECPSTILKNHGNAVLYGDADSAALIL